MLTMITLRSMALAVDKDLVNKTSFPYKCDDFVGLACSRLVIFKNSCFRTESLVDKFSVIYDTKTKVNKIGY